MVEHWGEALPGLDPLGLYEGEECGIVEHRGEALPGLDPLSLDEGEEGGMVQHRGEALPGYVVSVDQKSYR
jgi:hypothetical protein